MEFGENYLGAEACIEKYGQSYVFVDGELILTPFGVDPVEGIVTAFYADNDIRSDEHVQFEWEDLDCYYVKASESVSFKNTETGKITQIYKRGVDNTES